MWYIFITKSTTDNNIWRSHCAENVRMYEFVQYSSAWLWNGTEQQHVKPNFNTTHIKLFSVCELYGEVEVLREETVQGVSRWREDSDLTCRGSSLQPHHVRHLEQTPFSVMKRWIVNEMIYTFSFAHFFTTDVFYCTRLKLLPLFLPQHLPSTRLVAS